MHQQLKIPIYISARFMQQRLTGVQRYASEIYARLEGRISAIHPQKKLGGMPGLYWEQVTLPYLARGGVLWSPCNSGPIMSGRHVVTIHDLAFHDVSHCFAPKFVRFYETVIPRMARRARRILTVSEFSRQRIIEYCRCAPEKVIAIPNGVDSRFFGTRAADPPAERVRLGLPQRYVVAVGSLEPRKNLARIIQAWQTLGAQREGVSLLIVGAANKNVFAEMQIPDDPSIQVHGYVADEDLPLIYGLAEVCVYCSIYEGFGLPVLEAMASGTPVVCSENTSVPEAAGGAAVLVDPLDAASIAEGIRCLLGASALGDDLRQRGLERARGLTWDRTAEQTWEVLEAAALDG